MRNVRRQPRLTNIARQGQERHRGLPYVALAPTTTMHTPPKATPSSGASGTQPVPHSPRRPSSAHAHRSRHPLVWLLVSVAAGIMLDTWLALPWGFWTAAAIVLTGLWLVLWRCQRDHGAAIAILAAAAAWAGGWNHLHWQLFPANDLAHFLAEDDQPAALRAVARHAPRHLPSQGFNPLRAIPSGERSRLEVEVTALRDGEHWIAASGFGVLSVDGHLSGIQAGDELEIYCRARRTIAPGNPGEMDFASHARADRITFSLQCKYPECAQVIGRGSPWQFQRLFDWMQAYGDAQLWNRLGTSHSALADALLLGAREQMDFNRTEAFFRTNTIHFLAISGLHVGILGGSLLYLLRCGLLRRRMALAMVAAAAVLYATMTGADPSAMRAASLVVLLCLALALERPTLAFNCLAAAALYIVWRNPADLFRAGPQLSFLAVGTLIWFGPQWLKWQEKDALDRLVASQRPPHLKAISWLSSWWLRGTLATAAVWAATLPLIMLRFHLVSPVAILLSPLLTLPIAVALLSGFALLLLGWLWGPLESVLGFLCHGSLWVIDTLVVWGSRLPGGYWWVAGPPPWLVVLFYAGLLGWAAVPQFTGKRRLGLGLLAIWMLLWLAPSPLPARSAAPLECTFLSMGHGCAVVLHLPDGRTVLYDAGRLASPAGAARSVSSYLWRRGIRRIDAVVISHADVDHYNALPQLLEQFDVGAVYVSPVMWTQTTTPSSRPVADDSAARRVLRRAIERAGVPLIEAWDEQDSLPGSADVRLDFIHPSRNGIVGSDNANSLVLLVEYQGRRILLTGDVEGPGLAALLAREPIDCDVVLVPHHGSRRSDPPGFAAWSRPEWVVISGGFDRNDTQVLDAYQQHGARVLHTAYDGAVTVRIEGGNVRVDCYRQRE